MGMRYGWIVWAMMFLLCSGCTSKGPPPEKWAVVSQITVTQDGTQKHYEDPEKLRSILSALRQPGQQTYPEIDPERSSLPSTNITLTRTDGTVKIYRIKGDRYIRQDDAPWQQADPERIGELTRLLQTLPGDAPPNRQP